MTSEKPDIVPAMRYARVCWPVLLLPLLLLVMTSSLLAHDRRTTVVETVDKAGAAVVNIRTEQVVQRRSTPFFGFGDSLFNDFFKQFSSPRSYRTQALGSGAIVDSRGYLLTNAHVVEKASKIYVALSGERREREATLIGIDPATDLAVVKVVTDQPLPSLSFADDDDLLLGETVIAIGNPLGLENSVTTGVVSSPSRRLPDGKGGVAVFIQTDALINPGNSGGPLLDINGRLIGINTAIAQQAQGIGFAIPIKIVRRIVNELIRYGKVRTVYSGILPGEISRTMVRSRGAGGVLITEIDAASPAAVSGLQVADVILEVDGVQVDSASEYLSLLKTYAPGETVTLTLLRGVDELKARLPLAELPEGYALEYFKNIFGFEVVEDLRGLIISGVVPNSAAAKIDLRPGDRLTELESVRVDSLADLVTRIEATLGRLPLKMAIFRGNRGYLIELP